MLSTIKPNKGFSMIEILVALVILAIGLLGMATLMMNSLQTNQSAAWRSAATQAAYDLIERMRSNADDEVLSAKSYALTLQPASKKGGTTEPDDTCTNCTPEQLAQRDIAVWAYRLNKSIPGAEVVIQPSDNQVQEQNRIWCIGIFWQDSGGKEVANKDKDKVCDGGYPDANNPWVSYEVKVLL